MDELIDKITDELTDASTDNIMDNILPVAASLTTPPLASAHVGCKYPPLPAHSGIETPENVTNVVEEPCCILFTLAFSTTFCDPNAAKVLCDKHVPNKIKDNLKKFISLPDLKYNVAISRLK